MIAIDSSAFIAYLQNETNHITEKVERALETNNAILPPVVVVELLSDPILSAEVIYNIAALPTLEPKPGYWIRAGKTRSVILKRKLKARLADTLIAQMCIDYNIPLLTMDNDFKNFVKYCGLKLMYSL